MEGFDNENDPGPIAFDDKIPKPGPDIYIKRLRGKEALHFTLYGDRIRGVWYHWMQGRSQPHYQDEQKCPGCKKCLGKKWKGYLHTYCHEMKQEVFLELTPTAAKSLCTQMGSEAGMRGQTIMCERTKGDNGRLIVRMLRRDVNLANLPAEKNPMPSIMKLWEIAEQKVEAWTNENEGVETAANTETAF